MSKDAKIMLESLVDEDSLSDVLNVLVNICEGKAEHLRSNWQDEAAAKLWHKDAVIIDNIIRRIVN